MEARDPWSRRFTWTSWQATQSGQAVVESVTMFRSSFSCALFALCSATLAFVSSDAVAVQTYCVGTVAKLRTALEQAEIDGDESRIDLRSSYNFTSELRYQPASEYFLPAGTLTIEGATGRAVQRALTMHR